MGKKGTKKKTQWRTLSITEQDVINATNGTAYISNGNRTTGLNIDEASSVDDNFKYSGTNLSYLKRKSSAFSPSSNNFFNTNHSNRNDNFRINSYNTNSSYYYNKHNSSSINTNNENNNNHNSIAINTTSNASSVNNDTTIPALNSNNIRYTRSLSSSSRYSSNYNKNNSYNNANSNNRHKTYSMQNGSAGGSSSSSTKYYSSYGAGRATSRANRTSSYSSFYNRNNLNNASSNNELSSSAANKENHPKPLFNEDEYTRITTPRQDVIFKKGYLSRPRPSQLSSNDTNTTTSASASVASEESMSTVTSVPSSLSPEQCSSIHSDSMLDPEHTFMCSYIDQNGVLYVNPFVPPNGFDQYPGQVFMMPYGYPPYNFCPPDLSNTAPMASDSDNKDVERDQPSDENIQDASNEAKKDYDSAVASETDNVEDNEASPKLSDTSDLIAPETDGKPPEKETFENSDESNGDSKIEPSNVDDLNDKTYQPFVRNNCDPNLFNYGYSGPPIYPPIFYPINYYAGPPILPIMGPVPYELHPEQINEEAVPTDTVLEQENTNATEMDCDKSTPQSSIENDQNAIISSDVKPEIMIQEDKLEISNIETEQAEIENENASTVGSEISTAINTQSCSADDCNASNTEETESKQQPNLNVNVDEFVPRPVNKPHLNVNVKEFQPRYLHRNYNTNHSHNNFKPIVNPNITSNNHEVERDSKSPSNTQIVPESSEIIPKAAAKQIAKKESRPAQTTMAEQIKKSFASQDKEKQIHTAKPQSKVFLTQSNQNNNKEIISVLDLVGVKEDSRTTNSKLKDKLQKSNTKSNNKNKTRVLPGTSEASAPDQNNNKTKTKNMNNTATPTPNARQERQQNKVTSSSPLPNVLSYAQMLNKDLQIADNKETNKSNKIESTLATTPANLSENELDDAEVQMLIKSMETAEKLTALKDSWQTVKPRGKRNKQYKEISFDSQDIEKYIEETETNHVEVASRNAEETGFVATTTPIDSETLPEVQKDLVGNGSEDNDQVVREEPQAEPVKIDAGATLKSSEKKKTKNKKTAKKTTNAKTSLTKDLSLVKASEPSKEIILAATSPEPAEEYKNVKADLDLSVVEEDIDDNTLALKLFEDLEKELDMKLKSNPDEEDDDEEETCESIGTSPDILMKHSNLGRNLDMLNGFDYKYKTKSILKEEEEMVLNVIKSLSSNSASPIGCNKKSDNIFNASFMALNGNASRSPSASFGNTLGNIRTNMCEDPKNLVRKSSCLANTNISTQSCGKSKQHAKSIKSAKPTINNDSKVEIDVLNTVAEIEQHEDYNGPNTATVPSLIMAKKEEANSEYIQNCIKESLKWIKKMESVEKSIDDINELKVAMDNKVTELNNGKTELASYLSKQQQHYEKVQKTSIFMDEVAKTDAIPPKKEKKELNNGKTEMASYLSKQQQHFEKVQKTSIFMDEVARTDAIPSKKEKKGKKKVLAERQTGDLNKADLVKKKQKNKVDMVDAAVVEEMEQKTTEILTEADDKKTTATVIETDQTNFTANDMLNMEDSILVIESNLELPVERLIETERIVVVESKIDKASNSCEEQTTNEEEEHHKDLTPKSNNLDEQMHQGKETDCEKINGVTEIAQTISKEMPMHNGEEKNDFEIEEVSENNSPKMQDIKKLENGENRVPNLNENQIFSRNSRQLDVVSQSTDLRSVCATELPNDVDANSDTESLQNEIVELEVKAKQIENHINEIQEKSENKIHKLQNNIPQNSDINVEHSIEKQVNGSYVSEVISPTNGFHSDLYKDSELEKKFNSELLAHITSTKDVTPNIKEDLVQIDKVNGGLDHLRCDVVCNLVDCTESFIAEEKNIANIQDIKSEKPLSQSTNSHQIQEINNTEVPLYHNSRHKNHLRERLSHSCSDTNDAAFCDNTLDKHKSSSSLALQLKQLEEQLKKLDRLATPGLANNEHRQNSSFSSENDLNSLGSSETNSSTLEDSLTSPRSEPMQDANPICTIEDVNNCHDEICNALCNIKIENGPTSDFSSSNSSDKNVKNCDSLIVTNSENENCSTKLPPQPQTETNQLPLSFESHDPQKFPLTLAVRQWLAQEVKEKTPEPLLRLPIDPTLHTRIKSSLSLQRLHEADDSNDEYYNEDECWSLTDGDGDYDEDTEVEEDPAEENAKVNATANTSQNSKNLKSNPLHVSSLKIRKNHIINQINHEYQNDNDSDYNSDTQVQNKFDHFSDNTCERVASTNPNATKNNIKKTKMSKSDENLKDSSEQQQIDYYWDDFIENPSKYLQNPDSNRNNDQNKSEDNKTMQGSIFNTSLDTTESMFSSGTSSMNELHDLTPYESVYGKSIDYDKLLQSNNELLNHNNRPTFNDINHPNKCNNDGNDDDNDDGDDEVNNHLKIKLHKKSNNIKINHRNDTTSLDKQLNINNHNNNGKTTNNYISKNINKNNNDICNKPPEFSCILM